VIRVTISFNRVMFPFHARGRVIAFGDGFWARASPKYLNSAGNPALSQGAQSLQLREWRGEAARELGIGDRGEGYTDVVRAGRSGRAERRRTAWHGSDEENKTACVASHR